MTNISPVDTPRSPSTPASRLRPMTLLPRPLAFLAALMGLALTVGTSPLQGQMRVQLPADAGVHPTGDLFIQDLDVIWTAAGEVLERASILIRNGIIEAVGPGLEPPEGMEVIDGRGRTAIPGIVDEHSHIAQIGTNEGTAPIVPEVEVLDALDPTDFGIYRALQGGITTVRIMHGSSNPIGGQSAVIKPRWGARTTQELLIPGAPKAIKFALGENVTRKSAQNRGPASRFPASRPGVEAIYDQAFTAARQYQALWEAYEADPSSFRVPPRRDLRLETLVDVLEDRILVHAHSYRSDEILMLTRIADRYGFTLDNFTHALEAFRVADELREHGAGASIFSDWWQFKLEAYDAIPYNATILESRGVLTALNSDIPWLQPFMKWEIAKPVQYGGTDREAALRMLTLNPAIMLGVGDRVGSLEVGKEGDVAILTGDPFDAYSRVEMTVVDGIVYYDSNREEELRGEPVLTLPPLPTDRYRPPADAARVTGSAAVRTADLADLEPIHPGAGTVALVGGTIHPISGAVIEDGTLVMVDGRIQAVGPRAQVEIPTGARIVELEGRHVYPGMIDPLTNLGIFEFGQVAQATDRNEIGDFNPHIRALGGYNPHGRAPAVARARGVTAALTVQTGGIVQGMGSVVQLVGDTFERAEIRGTGALLVNLPVPAQPPGTRAWDQFADHAHGREVIWAGEEVLGIGLMAGGVGHDHDHAHDHGHDHSHGPRPVAFHDVAVVRNANGDPQPSLETGRMDELTEFFVRAREYQAAPASVRRGDEPFEANVWGGDEVLLEAMRPVLEGEIPVFFRADSEWQIRHVLLFLEEFPELAGVLVGGVESFLVADELAARDVPVILTRTRSPTPDRGHPVTASMSNAAVLHAAGVRFAFSTDDSSDVRVLPEHVGIAVAHGLPREVGLQAVTMRPAELLGLGDLMGSLEPGKRADLLITDGDPIQPLTRLDTMFIGGIEVDPRDNDQHRMFERSMARP